MKHYVKMEEKSSILQNSFLANAKVSSVFYMLTFFLITVSGSHHFVNLGRQNIIEIIGYVLLIFTVLTGAFRKKACESRDYLFAFVIVLLLLPGFVFEGLTLYRKAAFLLSAVVLVCTSIISKGLIVNRDELIFAIAGVIAGVTISFVMSLSDGDGIGALGSFDGGILYKNYFAGDILCVLIGTTCLSLFRSQMTAGRLFIICCCLALIVISGSKGAALLAGFYVLTILFQGYYSINSRTEKTLLVVLIICILVPLMYLLIDWITDVETYQYRVRGFGNYLNYVAGDIKHIIIGNSSLLYSGRAGYAQLFRELFGWNGSIEFAWLNVLMKHGVLGIIAYITILVRLFRSSNRCADDYKRFANAILLTLVLSSFVESYMETMHSVVGPFCFMLANGLCGKTLPNQGVKDKRRL